MDKNSRIQELFITTDNAQHTSKLEATQHQLALDIFERDGESFAGEIRAFLSQKGKNPATVADFLIRWEKHKMVEAVALVDSFEGADRLANQAKSA